jgi:hypothetical protein
MKAAVMLMIGFWLGVVTFALLGWAYRERARIARAYVTWWARVTGRKQ